MIHLEFDGRDAAMNETDRKSHWQKVYATKAEKEVSWFQENPTPSLDMIVATGISTDAGIIDVGGYLTPAAYAANLTATCDRLRNPDQLRPVQNSGTGSANARSRVVSRVLYLRSVSIYAAISPASLRLSGKFGIVGCGSSRKNATFSGVKPCFRAIAANGGTSALARF